MPTDHMINIPQLDCDPLPMLYTSSFNTFYLWALIFMVKVLLVLNIDDQFCDRLLCSYLPLINHITD